MRINDHEANRLHLLKEIRRAEPVSRTDLVRLTGLAAGTISQLTADLVRQNILIEDKAASTGSGRPRVELRLNPDAAYVVGATLLPTDGLDIGIVNLRGERMFSQRHHLSYANNLEELAEQLARLVGETILASPYTTADIHSVGVGLPATIDSVRGMLHWLQTYPLGPFPMAEIMMRILGLPVTIDGNTNIFARAEHWFGEGRQLNDFCLVMVGLSVNIAQYNGGMLWTGAGDLNPEFSHTKVVYEGGRHCTCGATGCLSMYCGMYGIVAQICERRGIAIPDFLHVDELFETFSHEARLGDSVANDVFMRAGQFLGTAMANYVNFWNPKRIIMMCANEAILSVIAVPFHAAFQQNTLPVFLGQVTVEFRVADEASYSKGAAAMVLEQLYRLPKDQLGRASRRL